MADMEKLQTYTVICEGGLDSNKNHVALAQTSPGAATRLLNYEPSLYGGYRKINGYVPLESSYEIVDPVNGDGPILLVHILTNTIIVARKLATGGVYNYYHWSSGSDWIPYTTGLSLSSTNVQRIRAVSYNLGGPESTIFVDGINGAVLFDGTDWVEVSSSGTGVDFDNAGGDQVLDAPTYVTTFKNHLFISGDPTHPQIVAHSAPSTDYDWNFANGAGQINVGFAVRQIKPFRDALYVFGATKIKKIVVDGTDFVIQDVTNNGGLLAPDSVVEVNGDLLFLAADGFRTVAGTERNEDVELGVASKKIQQDVTNLIASASFAELSVVVVRRKSQVRYFFSNSLLDPTMNVGIIGGLKGDPGSSYWEWGLLRGIRTSCATSGYMGNQEYVLHGDINGGVYRQEMGTNFNGSPIACVYSTPYFDFSDVFVRKTIHKIIIFIRPEGPIQSSMSFDFDWGDYKTRTPSPYNLESGYEGNSWDEFNWGSGSWASTPIPYVTKNVEGSFFSTSITFSEEHSLGSYSIQAIAFEYSVNGRK